MNDEQPGPAQRDVMEYDVAVVGAGPAGLVDRHPSQATSAPSSRSASSRRARPSARTRCPAPCMEPGPLDALLPEWRTAPLPIRVPVTRDEFRLAGAKRSARKPALDSEVAAQRRATSSSRWAGSCNGSPPRPSSSASTCSRVSPPRCRCSMTTARSPACRSATWACNTTAPAALTTRPAPKCTRRLTIIAEGCRGSLAKLLIKRYKLDAACDPQVYALGMKELWQLPPGRVQPGPRATQLRLAAGFAHLRRQLRLSPQRRPRLCRLRHRPRLHRSALLPVRSVPAVQASPRDACLPARAARSSPPARAASRPAAGSPCRSSRCRAPC